MMIQVRINSVGPKRIDLDVSEVSAGRPDIRVLHLDNVDSKNGIETVYRTLLAQFVKP
jgi:hypothetical protein